MLIVAIAILAFCSTCAGGLFALRLKGNRHLILAFSAGAVVAVAFFDLMPEAIALGGPSHSAVTLMSWVALGFFVYLILDRVQVLYGRPGSRGGGERQLSQRGVLGAASLSAHSFLDGVAIGVALQASVAVGTVVTIAVLAHDFSDGINTTNIVLKNGGNHRQALRWLVADAVTPAAGIASTFFFRIGASTLGVVLAVFAGFFLYVGASDLIPESHHAHPKLLTTATTAVGAAVIFLAVMLARR